jgi:mRNA interferase RelE/StbE
MYKVLISATFQRQLKKLHKKIQKRIIKALKELEQAPFTPRSHVDIKSLKGTKPLKHRLRVGDYRIIYLVESKTVKIIEVFKRSRGYRE